MRKLRAGGQELRRATEILQEGGCRTNVDCPTRVPRAMRDLRVGYDFAPVDRDQLMLLPPSMADWLPEDHLVWFVLDVVDELDLRRSLPGIAPTVEVGRRITRR